VASDKKHNGKVDKAQFKTLHILGRNLNLLRRDRRLSQDQLAVKANVTKRYIQMIEAGQKCPTLFTLARLRVALACRYDDLFQGI
jgi:transcriptional regulator with XRE-family HTH domain